LLHERIMQQIARQRSATPIEAQRGFPWRFRATAAAAMLAVLVPAACWWASSRNTSVAINSPHSSPIRPETRLSPASPVPSLPSLDTALASALEPASEQLGEGRFAYLDRDAQRLTRFVADQFDLRPTSRQ
jgi:hypothetical protein